MTYRNIWKTESFEFHFNEELKISRLSIELIGNDGCMGNPRGGQQPIQKVNDDVYFNSKLCPSKWEPIGCESENPKQRRVKCVFHGTMECVE